jgi:voltage-gated potassium channel Kch
MMRLLFLPLVALLSACGYRAATSPLASSSISVPYIAGDETGGLTAALIEELSASGRCRVVRDRGDITFVGKVVSDENRQIGYQYDRPPLELDVQKTRLVPNEERRELTIEFELVERASGKSLTPLRTMTIGVDYDFAISDAIQGLVTETGTSILSFSLGQLDSVEGAREGARLPLHKKVARAVVAGLMHERALQ